MTVVFMGTGEIGAPVLRWLIEHSGHQVVAVVDGDFTCKQLWQRGGRLKLKAANPTFADIVPTEGQTVEVWGVVIAAIKQFKR